MMIMKWIRKNIRSFRMKLLGFDKDPLYPFREHPRCPTCGKVYNNATTAKIWRHGRAYFFGVCSGVEVEHLHFHCERCGKSWVTERAPPLPPNKVKKILKESKAAPEEAEAEAEVNKEDHCRICGGVGIIKHKEKMYKCPDCWRGEMESAFWEGGAPTLSPASEPGSITPPSIIIEAEP